MKPSPKPTCSHDWFVAINNANLDATQRSVMFAAVKFMTWTTGGDIRPSRKVWGAKAGVTDRCMTTRLAQLKSLGLLREVEPSTATTTTTYAADYDRLLALAREGVEDSSSLEDSSTGKVFQSGWKNVRVRVENSSTNHNQYHNQDHNQSGCVQGTPDSGDTPEPAPPAPKRKTTRPARRIGWTNETGWHGIDADDRKAWTAAYPLVNIDAELAKMNAWLRINPPKKDYPRFINGWLGRAQEKAEEDPTKRSSLSASEQSAKEAAARARRAFYRHHPEIQQKHIADLKAADPIFEKVSDASILNVMPPALLAMPIATTGSTNA